MAPDSASHGLPANLLVLTSGLTDFVGALSKATGGLDFSKGAK